MIAARRRTYAALPGWDRDDHAAARAAFFVTADLLGPDWAAAAADTGGEARAFFEKHFVPVEIGTPPALLTGYYEPELQGSLTATPRFAWPLYALPAEHAPGLVGPSRAAIELGGLLRGQELVWLDSPVEAFLAQVQGSARVRLEDGRLLRLGYAGRNGQPYRSIGQELIRRGEVSAEAMSAQTIRAWCAAHPGQAVELFWHNPSFVFFRLLDLPESSGPIGAMGRPVTPLRSLAVDSDHIPLGAPVWVETRTQSRLCIAQDSGSAMHGPQRGDLFCGSGAEAGEMAGRMKDAGRLVLLLPPALAERMAPGAGPGLVS